MIRSSLLLLIILLVPVLATAETITVTDATINAGETYSMTADNTYVLDGFVYVEEGAILNIAAGTVVKAKSGEAENACALIITRGAQIFATGTPAKPIIFTAEADDVDDPNDLPLPMRGQWGGLIVLGNAVVNTASGTGHIEGIPEEDRTLYGGDDDTDNSGVIRYVSIRHGGTDIGSGKEINGLTMGAVGSGTTIEYVEVLNNKDDGFEWFGGTVNCKYLVSAFNGDDSFDYDEGFRGKGQFWLSIADPATSNRGGEHDGGTEPIDGTPFAQAKVWNATYIGGDSSDINADNDYALKIRDNAGTIYKNSIFMSFAYGVDIEDIAETEVDSRQRMDTGDIVIANNIFFNLSEGIAKHDYEIPHLSDNDNIVADPMITVGYEADATFLPMPKAGSPAWEDLAAIPEDGFYSQVNYKGAFGLSNWLLNWTALDTYNYVSHEAVVIPGETIVINDGTINAGETYTMYATNTYVLDGFVYVEDGATLNIEAGTVVKAKPGEAENASALIIAQGGKIFANGTKENPIIFTAEADDVNDPNDLPLPMRGQWGGLILLGNAVVNTASGTGHIEGIPEEDRTLYGGDDDTDNSGVVRYVSIRHGGTDIGSGKEVNGLTMGAVGSGTTIEYVEVINNKDDGFEWFGGTVNCKYLVSAFNGDDSFDYDEGFRGMGQFWLSIADPDVSNRGGEHDGGTEPLDGTPFAQAKVYNATYIGGDSSDINADNDYALKIRDNGGALYKNSIFMSFAYGVDVEDVAETEVDSKQRLDMGDIVLANNIWYNFSNGDTFAAIGKHDYESAHLEANGNVIADPMITVSYAQDMTFLPIPKDGSPAYENLASIPENLFYTPAAYKGAFGDENWLLGWTALDLYSYVSHDAVPIAVEEDDDAPVAYELGQNFPNPFNPVTTIAFTVPEQNAVTLTVFDMLGQKVSTLVDEVMSSGSYSVNWNAGDRSSGIYFYTLKSGDITVTRRMTLIK